MSRRARTEPVAYMQCYLLKSCAPPGYFKRNMNVKFKLMHNIFRILFKDVR